MKDYLVRVSAKTIGVRGFACVTTGLVREAAALHQTGATATAVLGRALTGGVLLGALLRVGHRVALRFDGDGPVGKVLVEADSYGRVRGYTGQPDAALPLRDGEPDVAGAVGRGFLTVVKDLRLRDLYRGVVPLQSGDIDVDLDYYLNQSEQVPSAVAVAVDFDPQGAVRVATGTLLQAIPPYDDEAFAALTARAQTLFPLSEWVAQERTPEEWLDALFAGTPYRLLEQRDLSFACSCSRARMAQALRSLGREQLAALAAEGEAEVQCHFCGRHHIFSRAELEALLQNS